MGVYLLGQLEGVRVGQVHVGRGDSQDEAALPANELQDHVLDLVLDVRGLVPHRHLGDAREVDESQVQHCGGEQRRWLRVWGTLEQLAQTFSKFRGSLSPDPLPSTRGWGG